MSDFFNIGDKVTPASDQARVFFSAGKVYEVVIDPKDNTNCVVGDSGYYRYALKIDFDLVEDTQSEEIEESLTGSFYIDINEYDGTMESIINAICGSNIALQPDFYDNCIEVKVSAPASLTKKQKLNKQGFTDEQIKKIESVLGEI